jgi:hypothetical protein
MTEQAVARHVDRISIAQSAHTTASLERERLCFWGSPEVNETKMTSGTKEVVYP